MKNVKKFLETVTVVDVETTDIDVKKAEIIEIASCRYINGDWSAASILFGSINPIPPDASAVNHISNRMIAGLSLFPDELEIVYALFYTDDTSYMVAHNAEFDRRVLRENIMRSFNQEPFEEYNDKNKWICTWRLAKAVLGVDYNNLKYNLSYLRYALDLDISDDVTAHRADADTLVAGKLIEFLINKAIENNQLDPNGDIGEQLIELCWAPKIVKTWPFGKHKGVPLGDVPIGYIQWAINLPLDSLDESNQNYDQDLAHSLMLVLEEKY